MSALIFAKFVGWQLVVAMVLLLAGYGLNGTDGLRAAMLGSLIAMLPNLYFTLQAFRFDASKTPVHALGALYRGEAGKFVLVAVICALVFKFVDVRQPLLLFISLFVMLMAQPIVSVLVLPALQSKGEAEVKKSAEGAEKNSKEIH